MTDNKITIVAGEPQEYIAIPKVEYNRLKRVEAEYLTKNIFSFQGFLVNLHYEIFTINGFKIISNW